MGTGRNVTPYALPVVGAVLFNLQGVDAVYTVVIHALGFCITVVYTH